MPEQRLPETRVFGHLDEFLLCSPTKEAAANEYGEVPRAVHGARGASISMKDRGSQSHAGFLTSGIDTIHRESYIDVRKRQGLVLVDKF